MSSGAPLDEQPLKPTRQHSLIFDGASLLLTVAIFLTLLILFTLFVQRQVSRSRINNSRKVPEVRIKALASGKQCQRITQGLDQVEKLRLSYLPKLTDCLAIQTHVRKPYLNRMIALDEITIAIDDTMVHLNPAYGRAPGETTYQYLQRLRKDHLPALPVTLIQKIAFLHEAARHRPAKFQTPQLMELRSNIAQFIRIVNQSREQLAPTTPEKTSKNPLSQWRVIGGGSAKRPRRTPFGGSDGGRFLVQQGYVQTNRSPLVEEEISLLPMGCSSSTENTPKKHQRRQSDSLTRSKEV
ncbi:unnamed protein product, partial [Mesorhabditis spiculigera]